MTPIERKIILLEKNVKQSQLAREFNVSAGMIAGLINGRHEFRSADLQSRIAEYLGVNPDEFWGPTSRRRTYGD